MSTPHLPPIQHRRRTTIRELALDFAVGVLIAITALLVGLGSGIGLGMLLLWLGSIA